MPARSSAGLGLLGGGGQAMETAEFAAPSAVVFAAVESRFITHDSRFVLVDIDTSDPDLLSTPVNVSVGAPALRRRLVNAWQGSSYRSIVSSDAYVSVSAQVGEGVTVSAGAVVSSAVRLGDHSHVNVGASLSHEVVLGEFSSVAPGARLTGGVRVHDGVFVGAGAVVYGEVELKEGCVIGAGAVLKCETVPFGVYVGVPARLVGVRKGWLDAV